jgi:hypothetical protein
VLAVAACMGRLTCLVLEVTLAAKRDQKGEAMPRPFVRVMWMPTRRSRIVCGVIWRLILEPSEIDTMIEKLKAMQLNITAINLAARQKATA